MPGRAPWHALRPCLESALAFRGRVDLRLIAVVDPASHAARRVRAVWPDDTGGGPRRIDAPEGGGFARWANRGLGAGSAPWLALLAPDALVTPGWLERLLEAAGCDERIAAVAPLCDRGRAHRIALPMGWSTFQLAAELARRGDPAAVDAVPAGAACWLLRRAALEAVGPYDEGVADAEVAQGDWCMRALGAGWRIAVAPRAFVHRPPAPPDAGAEPQAERSGSPGAGARAALAERWGEAYRSAVRGSP